MVGWNHPGGAQRSNTEQGKEHEVHRLKGGSNHGAETSPELRLPPAPEQLKTTLLQQLALMHTESQDVQYLFTERVSQYTLKQAFLTHRIHRMIRMDNLKIRAKAVL